MRGRVDSLAILWGGCLATHSRKWLERREGLPANACHILGTSGKRLNVGVLVRSSCQDSKFSAKISRGLFSPRPRQPKQPLEDSVRAQDRLCIETGKPVLTRD